MLNQLKVLAFNVLQEIGKLEKKKQELTMEYQNYLKQIESIENKQQIVNENKK